MKITLDWVPTSKAPFCRSHSIYCTCFDLIILSGRDSNKQVLTSVLPFLKLNVRQGKFTRTLENAHKIPSNTHFMQEERWLCQFGYHSDFTKTEIAGSLNCSLRAFRNVLKHPEYFCSLPRNAIPSGLSGQHRIEILQAS